MTRRAKTDRLKDVPQSAIKPPFTGAKSRGWQLSHVKIIEILVCMMQNTYIKIFVSIPHLFLVSNCGILDEEQNWIELNDEECREAEYRVDNYTPEIEGL